MQPLSPIVPILVIIALLSVACGQTQKTPSPVVPSATAISVSASTPTPIPALAPTATAVAQSVVAPQPTVAALMSARQYAEFCGELNSVFPRNQFVKFVESGGTDESSREAVKTWVGLWVQMRPPPELAEYNRARVDQYQLQFQHGGFTQANQEAYLRELQAVDAMPSALRGIMFENNCIFQLTFAMGQRTLLAHRRTETRGPAPNPPTVADYAERCGDIRYTAPLQAGRRPTAEHFATSMSALVPPSELQEFHDHMIETLTEWANSDLTVSVGPILKEATQKADDLPPENHIILLSNDCISGRN